MIFWGIMCKEEMLGWIKEKNIAYCKKHKKEMKNPKECLKCSSVNFGLMMEIQDDSKFGVYV